MEDLLIQFINDPYNDINNFELGYSYENIGQTASALSYYLRCAEFTNDKNLACECLLRMSLCLSKQGKRDTMELVCIQHAISILPDSSEANYLMSLYHSYRKNWMESYMFACIGLLNDTNPSFKKDFPYSNEYQLLFQKAYSGYNKGKLKESEEIYNNLLENEKLDQLHIDLVKSNLSKFPVRDSTDTERIINNMLKYDNKLYTINNYHKEESCNFKVYSRCPISDCIRRGYRWEEHNHTIIDQYVRSDSVCVEVGSHIGSISVKLAKCCENLYCFEPLKESFELLKQNLSINECNNVKLYNLGLSNKNAISKMDFISVNNPGGSGLYYNSQKINSNVIELNNEYLIELITLDSLKIEKLNYLKIDVEGYEKNVIDGSYNTIKKFKPYIVVEIFEDMNTFNKMSIDQIKERYKNIINLGYKIEHIWGNDYLFKPIIENISETLIEYDHFNKLDIVLQGGFNDHIFEIVNDYLELPFVNKIIISCWEDDNIQYINNERIIIVQSKMPKNPGTGQRNLQIISSLNGLKKVETEFAIKLRNDQKYNKKSMMKMYYFYQEYKDRKKTFYYNENKPKNRICVAGNFSEFSFHPRDHLFWGNKNDLIDVFSIPLEKGKVTDKIKFIQPEDYSLYYDYFIRSETYIGAHYLANFNRTINYYLLDPKKYLYDNSECYQETKLLSDKLTPQIFKSFPREGIDLEWYKYKLKRYPYESQREKFKERWHEDGL